MQKSRLTGREASPTATLTVFMLAHFSHHVCTAAIVPLLPLIRDAFQLDYLQSGLLLSAFSVSYGLLQLPMAAISERFGGRRVVALGLVCAGIACISIGFSWSYVQLLLSLALLGIAGSTYHAPASALLSRLFTREARGRSLGLHIGGGTTGLMAAPVLAIFVASVTGNWRNSFFLMGVPVMLSGVLLWTLTSMESAEPAKGTDGNAAARELSDPLPLRQIARRLGAVVLIAVMTQMLVSGLNSFLPIYLVDKHGVPQNIAGLIMSVVFGAGVVGAFVGGTLSDRFGRKPILITSIVGAGPLIVLVTLLPLGPVMIVVIALYGLVQAFRLATVESHIADVVPVRQRATILGAYNLVALEATGIMTPLFGWLMDRFGLNGGYGLLAAAALVASVLVLALWKKVTGQGWNPKPEAV